MEKIILNFAEISGLQWKFFVTCMNSECCNLWIWYFVIDCLYKSNLLMLLDLAWHVFKYNGWQVTLEPSTVSLTMKIPWPFCISVPGSSFGRSTQFACSGGCTEKGTLSNFNGLALYNLISFKMWKRGPLSPPIPVASLALKPFEVVACRTFCPKNNFWRGNLLAT